MKKDKLESKIYIESKTLNEKIKDMLFRMFCHIIDDHLHIDTLDTVITTENIVNPAVSYRIKLFRNQEFSEQDLYTYLEEEDLYNRKIITTESYTILQFDIPLDKYK